MIKEWIIKSNEWYDKLPEPKRAFFFFGVVFMSLVIVLILSQYFNYIWGFIGWAIIFMTWRLSYVYFSIKKDIENSD